MRRLWAQIAALGVGRIILTNAERVERNYFDTHLLAAEQYRPLLIEGLQQARDTRLPLVSVHRQFKILVEDDLDGLFAERGAPRGRPGAATPLGAACASSGNVCCSPSGRRAGGTISSGACSWPTVSIRSGWAAARCAATRPAWRS